MFMSDAQKEGNRHMGAFIRTQFTPSKACLLSL